MRGPSTPILPLDLFPQLGNALLVTSDVLNRVDNHKVALGDRLDLLLAGRAVAGATERAGHLDLRVFHPLATAERNHNLNCENG